MLENLFRYARGDRAHARENFTTEAFASCLRKDPTPLMAILRGADPPLVGETVSIGEILTQAPIPSVGALDLVLHGTDATGRFELWGELKVDAPESGDQISRYLSHLAGIDPREPRPRLFTVGRSPLAGHGELPHVTWHQVARAASNAQSPYWKDFVEYMKLNRLTDDFDELLSTDEARSLSGFDGLVGKVDRILETAFQDLANPPLAGFRWPPGSVRKGLISRFSSHGELLVSIEASQPRTSQLVVGAEATGKATWLTVRAETWPSQSDLQRTLRTRADEGGFDPTVWTRPEGSWGGLRTRTHWTPGMRGDQAAGWFVARIRELDRAGVLAAMQAAMTLPKGDPAEQVSNTGASTDAEAGGT